MAIGDDALAAGMDILTGSEPANTLDTEINITRDEIARRTNEVTPVAKGGTGSTTAAGSRANLGVPETAVAALKFTSSAFGRLWFEAPGVAFPTEIALASSVNAKASQGDLNAVRAGVMSSDIYGRGASGAWRSLAVQADGILVQTASARRFKENIAPLDVTDEQLAALELVAFDWIADHSHDVGVIADDVEQVLPWAVFHDDNGRILGVHYDRLALALLPVVQRLLARVAALEAVISDAQAPE